MEGHLFTTVISSRSAVTLPVASADTALPQIFPWLQAPETTVAMLIPPAIDEAGYALLAAEHAAEDAERRQIARRRPSSWATED